MTSMSSHQLSLLRDDFASLCGVEVKVDRHVRDVEYWGMPYGTLLEPGMKPIKKNGKRKIAMPTLKKSEDNPNLLTGDTSIYGKYWKYTFHIEAEKFPDGSTQTSITRFALPIDTRKYPNFKPFQIDTMTLGLTYSDEQTNQAARKYLDLDALDGVDEFEKEHQQEVYDPLKGIPAGISERHWINKSGNMYTSDMDYEYNTVNKQSIYELGTDLANALVFLKESRDPNHPGERDATVTFVGDDRAALDKLDTFTVYGKTDEELLKRVIPQTEKMLDEVARIQKERKESVARRKRESFRLASSRVQKLDNSTPVVADERSDATDIFSAYSRLEEHADDVSSRSNEYDDPYDIIDFHVDAAVRMKVRVEQSLHKPIKKLFADDPTSGEYVDLMHEKLWNEKGMAFNSLSNQSRVTDPLSSEDRNLPLEQRIQQWFMPELEGTDYDKWTLEQHEEAQRRAVLIQLKKNESVLTHMKGVTKEEELALRAFLYQSERNDQWSDNSDRRNASIAVMQKVSANCPTWEDVVILNDTHDFISTWAGTSADTNTKSLALQQAVNELLVEGAKTEHFSDYINGDEVINEKSTFINAFVVAVYQNTQQVLKDKKVDYIPGNRGMGLSWEDAESIDGMPDLNVVDVEEIRNRVVSSSVYDAKEAINFQWYLKEQSKDHRITHQQAIEDSTYQERVEYAIGKSLDEATYNSSFSYQSLTELLSEQIEADIVSDNMLDGFEEAQEMVNNRDSRANITIGLQPLSSFSLNKSQAQGFGNSDSVHVVIEDAAIPADRVWSLSSTGPGCSGEEEFVVLGGEYQVNATAKLSGSEGDGGWDDDEQYAAQNEVLSTLMGDEEFDNALKKTIRHGYRELIDENVGTFNEAPTTPDIIHGTPAKIDVWGKLQGLITNLSDNPDYREWVSEGRDKNQLELSNLELDYDNMPKVAKRHIPAINYNDYFALIGLDVPMEDAYRAVYIATRKRDDIDDLKVPGLDD